jgi:hypothetical protein
MCRAIDAAYRVDEVKYIRDKAVAWEVYSRQAKNVEAERRACEIRLRAERKAGALLKAMEKAKGSAGPGRGKAGAPAGSAFTTAPTLADLGVTPKQSSRWQKLADVPDEQFDAALADQTEKPTTNGIIAAAQPKPARPAVSDAALWLWGRLNDFQRNDLLGREPNDVLSTMTEEMLDDVHRLAPAGRELAQAHRGDAMTRDQRNDKQDQDRLSEIVARVIEACGGAANLDVSPSWVATQAFIEIDPGFSVRKDRPLVYIAAHLELRQMARQQLAQKWGSKREEPKDELFPELQERYPVKREHPDEEPVYRRRELLSDADVRYNLKRLRSEADAKLRHADALEAWWKTFKKTAS